MRGNSSVGRASDFQAEGRGFESRLPLFESKLPAFVAQLVEHHFGRVGVIGSNPIKGSKDLDGSDIFCIRQFLKIKKNNG